MRKGRLVSVTSDSVCTGLLCAKCKEETVTGREARIALVLLSAVAVVVVVSAVVVAVAAVVVVVVDGIAVVVGATVVVVGARLVRGAEETALVLTG